MSDSNEIWIVFDFRIQGANSKMIRLKYDWKARAIIERIGPHHSVMIIRPGGARELVR
jgi:hypothetical protein